MPWFKSKLACADDVVQLLCISGRGCAPGLPFVSCGREHLTRIAGIGFEPLPTEPGEVKQTDKPKWKQACL